jgi:signal transduction histidine kinase/CheY-like chemotaxis protein
MIISRSESLNSYVRKVGRLANLASSFTALAAMVLWATSHGFFPDLGPRMRFNGALVLLLLGASQWLLHERNWRNSGRILAWLAIIISAVTVAQDFFGIDAHIDNFFVRDLTPLGLDFNPGRMAPSSAVSFISLGVSILFFEYEGLRRRIAQSLILLAGALSLLGIFGYIFNARSLYEFSSFIKLSEYTAGCVCLLVCAILCSKPDYGLLKIILARGPTGSFARRMLTATCIFPPTLGLVVMFAEESDRLTVSTASALVAIATVFFFFGLVWRSVESMSFSERALSDSESKFRMMAEKAERASQAKTQFLANMSHEIRTPVGAIMGFTEMLRSDRYTPLEKSGFMAVVERNSQNLLRLIDDILDLSKVEAEKIVLELSEVHLGQFFEDLSVVMSLLASDKGIEFKLHLAENTPSRIVTDGLRLRQILTNVIGNAIKFTDKGSVELFVTSRSRELKFTIVDTGPGISAENIDKLFKAFSQADATFTRKYGGSGLGLVLSKRLSQLLGGDLRLASTKLGRGSTFEATIRPEFLAANDFLLLGKQRLIATGQSYMPYGESADLHGLKILLVEDSADNQMLIQNYLRSSGVELIKASDGEEGVEMAIRQRPDLILMDIQMPKLDGHDATKRLRGLGFSKPIVALTAHAMREERNKCFTSGCTDYLTKPIKRDVLIEVISKYVRNPTIVREPQQLEI